jgi:UDP-2,3-diacylglucosamine pyrophosphatase LpxH
MFLNDKVFQLMLKYGKLLPPEDRAIIIGGDFLDAPFLMERKKEFKEALKAKAFEEHFIPLAEEEILIGNSMLDAIQEVFPKVIFMQGNHDWRYGWFKDNCCPHAYKHNFDLELQLKLKERGIPVIEYNNWLDVGNMSITHGMFHGSTHCKKHYEASGGRNVIYGHVHHHECKSFMSRGHSKKAWSLPAMCDLNPEYMKNKDSNWTNGFASMHMKCNGNFNLYIHEMYDEKIVLPSGIILK